MDKQESICRVKADFLHHLGETDMRFRSTFPNHRDPPTGFLQRRACFAIPLPVPRYLSGPELAPGLRQTSFRTIFVSVPKTPVDKYAHSIARQNDIWRARKVAPMKPKPETRGM